MKKPDSLFYNSHSHEISNNVSYVMSTQQIYTYVSIISHWEALLSHKKLFLNLSFQKIFTPYHFES